MKHKISVIMSCYNENIDWIKKSITSILNQTYSNIEFIIVIDDPNNYEIIDLVTSYLKSDSRIKIHVNERNEGLVYSLNKAIDISTGEFIARMDADDISDTFRLEKQLDFMIKNPSIDLVSSLVTIIDENGDYVSRNSKLKIDELKLKKILPTLNVLNHPTWLVRRSVYKNLNGYRDISRNEDYDFLLRLITSEHNVYILDEYLLQYRVRSNSISNSQQFKQHLATLYSKTLYKQRINNGADLHSYEYFNKFINEKYSYDKDVNYCIYSQKYNEGLRLIKTDKKIKGIFNILYSMLKSKYIFIRTLELVYYKLVILL